MLLDFQKSEMYAQSKFKGRTSDYRQHQAIFCHRSSNVSLAQHTPFAAKRCRDLKCVAIMHALLKQIGCGVSTMSDSNDVIQAYCVRCKASVEMLHPEPVWTRRGTPGARGECPVCGGTIFRMGMTTMHEGLPRPTAITIQKHPRRVPPKIAPNTVYITYTADDEEVAEQIAADLNKIGLTTWLHDAQPEDVNWAGGVHPALKDCSRMVVVLSAAAIQDSGNVEAWTYFAGKRKPIVIAHTDPTPPPDTIRRSARFNFSRESDYKSAFRQMLQALS